jgi:iron complex outermembrane recepter protein
MMSGRTCGCGALVLAAAGVVNAQNADRIATVVVMAERREASIQDVPMAVSALTASQLSDGGIVDADGLANRLTTFDVQRNSGLPTTSLRIRRVGNIGNIPTFEPAVGIFVDGAFRSRSFLGMSNLLALDHVEVLRGPQTALYGKNVSAGLIGLYTRKPGDHLRASGEIERGWIDSPGTADSGSASVDVSGPIAAHLGAGIAARVSRHGHTVQNVLPGGKNGDDGREMEARAQLASSPNDALNLRLLLGYMRERDDQGEADVYFAPGAASTQVVGLLQQLGLVPSCPDNTPRNRKVCSVYTNTVDVKSEDATLLAEYRLASGTRFKSMTSWDKYDVLRIEDDAVQLFAPMLFYHDPESGRSIQEELTLQSADDTSFRWLIGAFYYDNHYARGDHGRQPMFGPNGDLAYNPIWQALLGGLSLGIPGQFGIHDSTLNTDYISGFGSVSWQISPKISLRAAVRWQQERKEATINNSVTAPGLSLVSAILTPSTTLAGQPVNGSLSRKTQNVPWSITSQYRLGDEASAWFTVAQGSKSGGFNTGFGDAPRDAREYADETIRHYEIGAKASRADRRLSLDASAFFTSYRNYHDAAFISAQFSVGNAERVEIKGAELEGSFALHERLALDFAFSLADLTYARYTHGLCYPGRVPDGSTPGTCVLTGRHPIQAPPWQVHAGLQYSRPLEAGNLSARLDWSWTDRYNTSFSADPTLTRDAYSDISLRVGVPLRPSLDLVFWGDNLLNKTIPYYDVLLNLFNDASFQSYLAAPRRYGLSVRWHF